MNRIATTVTIGELAAQQPPSMKVFHRRGIDFCCGGKRTLEDACRKKGLDPQEVAREIEAELAAPAGEGTNWSEQTQSALIAHLLERFHDPLPDELDRLYGMAFKVLRVHGPKDPERFAALAETVAELRNDLIPHLLKEEQILFPWILSGRPVPPGGPVDQMLREHDSVGELLEKLGELTDGYRVPEGACNTWRALWMGLEAFDAEMREHIHLENNILFPRALAQR